MLEKKGIIHKVGRPRIFESPEEFVELSNAYFRESQGQPISWTGLCLAVGCNSRQALDRYKKGDHGQEFVGPIKNALLVVERFYEEVLDGAKAIFVLKNFDWTDRTESEVTNTVSFGSKTEVELDNIIEGLTRAIDEEE